VTRRELLIGGGAAVVAVGVGAYFGIDHLLAPTPGPGVLPTPVPGPTGPFKPPVRGFLTRSAPTQADDWVLGQVVTLRWVDVQSGPGASLTHPNPIDSAVAACKSFNAAHPQSDPSLQRGLRVRFAPLTKSGDWPTQIGGAPVAVTDPADHSNTVVGHFWTPEYYQVYSQLQQLLAGAYDAVPEVREIGLAMVSLVYDEPFRRYSFPQMQAAGWSPSADQTAFSNMLQAHRVWRTTNQFMSFNPYAQPSGGDDEDYTEQVMTQFRAMYGKQAVLMNNSIRAADLGNAYDAMYSKMQSLGPPISFQTAGSKRLGDAATTFEKCVRYGACSVELPGSASSLPASVVQSAQAQLLANPS
jgi:hypothetical protein